MDPEQPRSAPAERYVKSGAEEIALSQTACARVLTVYREILRILTGNVTSHEVCVEDVGEADIPSNRAIDHKSNFCCPRTVTAAIESAPVEELQSEPGAGDGGVAARTQEHRQQDAQADGDA